MGNDETADDVHRRQLSRLFMEVRSLAICNRTYFKNAPGTTNERFYGAFSQLLDHLDNGLVLGVNTLLTVAPQFDFDKSQPGNGYRSMITVIQKCCLRIMTLARYVTVNRESYLFRANHYSKELEAFVTTLGQLRACLYYLQKLVQFCNEGELFPDENTLSPERYKVAERLLQEVEYLSQESFYGRCLGFQFCESMRRPLTTINVAMACYGEGYQKSNHSLMRLANSVLSCGKYLLNPEQRAKQVVNMTRTSDIYFCKSFWSLPENSVMQNVPLYMCPSMAVTKVITIEPVPFELPLADESGHMLISPPSAHIGVGPVTARLISSEYRSGQEVWFSPYGLRLLKTPLEKSPCLIIHCHGGGFVAQSSASHQMYLNFWANDLGIPILSVDYTLAPECHFPRQQEELFFAYCWALKNCHMLGSLAEKICIIGDSAGANMAVSVAMRLASCGLRQPDAVISVYGGLLVKYAPSPSRIMSLMDPLLPLGVVALCLRAYTGEAKADDVKQQNMNKTEDKMLIDAADELEKDKSKLPGRHSCSGTSDGYLTRNDNLEVGESSTKFSSHCTSSAQHIISKCDEPVPSVSTRFHQSHHREDSGFFDIGEQQDTGSVTSSESNLKSSDKMSCTFSSNSLLEPENRSDFGSKAAFALKESSDEESDSARSSVGFAMSSDEQSGQEFNADGTVEENEISSTHHSSSFASCRSTSEAKDHLHQTVSSPQFFSDAFGSSPILLPPPDSSSPLMSNYARLCHFAQSPMEKSKNIKNSNDPYVSPALASDSLLRNLCPVYVLTCHLDPLLDDSLMFARRLRLLEKTVHLEILHDLPHGFLNFVLVSPEARAGSGRCVHAIKKMLNLDD